MISLRQSDFTWPGKILCMVMVLVGIALFAIPVGTIFEAFGEVLGEVDGGGGGDDDNDDDDNDDNDNDSEDDNNSELNTSGEAVHSFLYLHLPCMI